MTTDEERERKAELQNPGTYHVVANPKSFVALPEYREENVPATGFGDAGTSVSSALTDEDDAPSTMSADAVGSAEDPNVVILRVFEEPVRRPSAQLSTRPMTNPVSPTSSHDSATTASRQGIQQAMHHADSADLSMLDLARRGGPDAPLLQHYRTAISPYILRDQILEGEEDLFEVQARSYPPVTTPLLR